MKVIEFSTLAQQYHQPLQLIHFFWWITQKLQSFNLGCRLYIIVRLSVMKPIETCTTAGSFSGVWPCRSFSKMSNFTKEHCQLSVRRRMTYSSH